jgi:aconitase B
LLSDEEFSGVIAIVREILDNLCCIFGNTIDTQIVDMHINGMPFEDIEQIFSLEKGYAERAYRARIQLIGSCFEAALIEYFGKNIHVTRSMFEEIDEDMQKLKIIDSMLSSRSETRYSKKNLTENTLF